MKKVLVDSSAFYAVLDDSDPFYKTARECFERAEVEQWHLITTNYVFHESLALIQHRLGWDAADELLDVLLPLCEVVFVDESLYSLGLARCRQARERSLSLTDCISFEVAKQRRIRFAMAQDRHFENARLSLPI